MKKILFITAFTPSEISAAEKNTRLLLEDLGRDNKVDMVYFAYKDDVVYTPKSKNVRIVEKIMISMADKLRNVLLNPFLYPIFTAKFNRSVLRRLKNLASIEKYDLVICDHSQMFLYAKYLDASIPKFLICHDVIYQRISRVKGKLMTAFCKFSERTALNVKNSFAFSFSDKDCRLIKELYGIEANLVLDYIDEKILNSKPTDIKNNEFAMMANWKRSDNIEGLRWFVDKVTPLINKEIIVHIIGSNLPNDMQFAKSPLVHFKLHGFVDNPYPLISNCRAFISPLFTGAGIKVKVIEALACGVPVVGTDISFEGFDQKYKDFMLEFNTAEDCAEQMDRDFSIEKRCEMKELFVSSFTSKTIPSYIKELVSE